LAVCDKKLSGKELDKEIGFTVSPKFYGTKEINEAKLKKLFKEVDSANLVGEKSVSAALEEKLGKKENIIKINTTPHIQIYFIKGGNK